MKNLIHIFLLFCSFSFAFGQPPGCFSYTKAYPFNCHQYVRGCLTGKVNLTTQIPISDLQLSQLNSSNINSGSDFIRVLLKSESDAASQTTSDHSSYNAGGASGFPFWATPGFTSNSLCSGNENVGNIGAGSCEYFAYIGDVTIAQPTTSLAVGTTHTFSLTNRPSAVTIDNVTATNVSNGSVTITKTATTFTLSSTTAVCSFLITVYLKTSNSTGIIRTITQSGSIGDKCGGLLNGQLLQTFNNVSNSSNSVVMNCDGWTWQKTSGSATYTTANNGKNMNFNLTSGCSTFTANKSGCGTKTVTFCKSGSMSILTESQEEPYKIEIYDMFSSSRLKSLVGSNSELTNYQLTEDLPKGFYIIIRNGISEKYAKLQ
jgi:hypothetical protein